MISISIASSGIDETVKALRAYAKGLKKNGNKVLDEAATRLLALGESVATTHYSSGSTDGNKDFRITQTHEDDTYWLIADGEQIGFLEFGAGATASPDAMASQVTYPIAPGSWSNIHNGPYSRKGYWWYANRKYQALMPTRGMFNAYEAMRTQAQRIIEEAGK